MKRIAIVVCLLSLAVAPHVVSAAEISPPETGLEFEVGNNFRLTSLDGLSVAWKKRVSAERGWRLGVDLSGNWTDEQYFQQSPFDTATVNEDDAVYSARVKLQKLFYSAPHRGVSGYWGIGPSVAYWHRYYERRYDNAEGLSSERKINGCSAGLICSLGVEWRVAEQIAVGAEYVSSLVYSYETNKSYQSDVNSTSISESTTDRVQLIDEGAAMSVTVFF